ncbi:MAG: hypothetical protein JST60_13065 [Chloroflexi bacterium SZAS-1]|jgi:hypothetical protein|nr:hypothetical protein [Chloroflexi bacterium SZAS-1]
MFQRIGGIVLLALLFLQNIGAARLDQAPQAKKLCFQQETGWCIRDRFLEYWWSNGGLPVFGYPLSPPRNEINRETGKSYLTQWFERARFELHPELAAPYDVLLGRLGDDGLQQRGVDWRLQPGASGGG